MQAAAELAVRLYLDMGTGPCVASPEEDKGLASASQEHYRLWKVQKMVAPFLRRAYVPLHLALAEAQQVLPTSTRQSY